jgi:hypothetical protein
MLLPGQVLLKLHSDVLPALVNPLLLSDFLSHSLDRGGLEGMLALNGIFRLVTRHGLEYPAFYARLYGLITSAAFMHKQRCAGAWLLLAELWLSSCWWHVLAECRWLLDSSTQWLAYTSNTRLTPATQLCMLQCESHPLQHGTIKAADSSGPSCICCHLPSNTLSSPTS